MPGPLGFDDERFEREHRQGAIRDDEQPLDLARREPPPLGGGDEDLPQGGQPRYGLVGAPGPAEQREQRRRLLARLPEAERPSSAPRTRACSRVSRSRSTRGFAPPPGTVMTKPPSGPRMYWSSS